MQSRKYFQNMLHAKHEVLSEHVLNIRKSHKLKYQKVKDKTPVKMGKAHDITIHKMKKVNSPIKICSAKLLVVQAN